jgi:hypothetical protein
LPLKIRAPTIDELSGLSGLCFRSKAVWGYDEDFMKACRGELLFEPRDLEMTFIAVAEHGGEPIGVAQVKVVNDEADLLKLFVEHIAPGRHPSCVIVFATPSSRGRGINRAAYHPLHLRIR